MRIALGIEYDGRAFCGWQRQEDGRSVQACVEAALGQVADHPVTVRCAGRTDAGVHATAQVAHFDTSAQRPLHGWILGANTHLPGDVCLTWAREVSDEFHARFSARSRTYVYLIVNRRARSALYRDRAHCVHRHLDAERMQRAARELVGTHDFSSFRAAECQAKTPERTVHGIDVSRHGEWVSITVEANAFLHHMVRNIAGVLLRIGTCEAPIGWASEVLAARDRRRAGVTAPPQGLYLVGVAYPPRHGLPDGAPLLRL